MPARSPHGYITIGILICLLFVSSIWYATSPSIRKLEAFIPAISKEEEKPAYEGEHIVVNINTMKVELRNGTTTLNTLDILSVGKPGSYYETIGGVHLNDYTIKEHFSSIGHVYMPWSVHVYGNFFLHGIPYYPDGTEVSSEYSGGCIRLSTPDAKMVYDFVERGMPIVITESTERDFLPTASSTPTIESMKMTHLMVATVSLEVIAQDIEIRDIDGISFTTRRKLLPRLVVDGDEEVSKKIAQALGEATFVDYMNQKARALGLTNTSFTGINDPVLTTKEDMERFARYISNYKSYLITIGSSTQELSQ